MLESFIDPYDVNFLQMSEDPIPTFHSLEQNFTTGYLTVPVVGAGTANTEFEVLTGMSMQYFGTGEYPYKTILKVLHLTFPLLVMAHMSYITTLLLSTAETMRFQKWDLIHLQVKS